MFPEGLRAMKRFPVWLLFVVAACSPGGAQDGEKKGPPSAAAPGDALGVTLLEMAPRSVPVSFEAVGRTEGSREVQVRARVSGILERQLYNEGDAVPAGAPLFFHERAPLQVGLPQGRGPPPPGPPGDGRPPPEPQRAKTPTPPRPPSPEETRPGG